MYHFSHLWHQLDCKHFWGKALFLLCFYKVKPSEAGHTVWELGVGRDSYLKSKRLTKQCWFIICINQSFLCSCINSFRSEFEQYSVSYLGTNGKKEHISIYYFGHWDVLSDFPFLNSHYRSSLQGQFNNSQD